MLKQSKPFTLLLSLTLCLASSGYGWANDNTNDSIGPQPDGTKISAEQKQEAGLPAGAIEYNKGVELFQIAQIQSEKGNSAGQKKLLKEAIKQFEDALGKNPKLVEAQSNIGFAYLTLHDYRRSIKAFEDALKIDPRHLNTLNGLSTAYAFDGKIDEALKTFDKLTTLDPGNSQYFFNKGSVLQKSGRMEAAEQAYQQALKIKPDDQRALFNMGTLYENQGKLEQARPYYEKAKGAEIGNTIGLEAIRRLDAINKALSGKP